MTAAYHETIRWFFVAASVVALGWIGCDTCVEDSRITTELAADKLNTMVRCVESTRAPMRCRLMLRLRLHDIDIASLMSEPIEVEKPMAPVDEVAP